MKQLITILLLSFTLSSFAQDIIMIDTTISMSKGIQPALQVSIPDITLKAVKQDWLKYIGNSSKEKSGETNGEILQNEAVVLNISSAPFKIYSKLLATSTDVKLTVWISQDDIIFFSPRVNMDQSLAMRKYLYDFAFLEYQELVAAELKREKQKSDDLDTELSKIIKDREKSLKIIAENQRSIEQANDNIITNNNDLKSISSKIISQKSFVEKTASDENANKGALKTLNDLENEKEGIQAKKETNNKHIISWDKEIRAEERNVADAIQNQGLKEEEILIQKNKVEVVTNKLSNLK